MFPHLQDKITHSLLLHFLKKETAVEPGSKDRAGPGCEPVLGTSALMSAGAAPP